MEAVSRGFFERRRRPISRSSVSCLGLDLALLAMAIA